MVHKDVASVACCSDPEVARILVARGVHVVLCGPDAAVLGAAAARLRPHPGLASGPHPGLASGPDHGLASGPDHGPAADPDPAPGRLAVLVGDPDDPAVTQAALDLAHEVFGQAATIMASAEDADRLGL